MSIIKRLLFLSGFFLLYLVVREFLELYVLIRSLHPAAGYGFLVVAAAGLFYFAGIPVLKIWRMPVFPSPAREPEAGEAVMRRRLQSFKNNPHLSDLDWSGSEQEQYDRGIILLREKSHEIRKRYVRNIFYTTSIVQNGFLDAFFILSGAFNLIKEIFGVYSGRVSRTDLLKIGRNIYYAVAIGGSEAVEYATEEVFSRFTTEGVRSIPFIERIMGSLADGYINALLLTRVSYITENYCTLTYIESEKKLNPSPRRVFSVTSDLTKDIISSLRRTLRNLARERVKDTVRFTVRPVKFVWEKTLGKSDEENITLPDDLTPVSEPPAPVHNRNWFRRFLERLV